MQAFAIDSYGAFEGRRLRDLPEPRLTRGEALVRVHAAALNPADLKVVSGRGAAKLLHAAEFPLVLGYDFSGVIERVGAEAGPFEPSDAVFGFLPYSFQNNQGSCAEFVAIPASSIAKKPSEISHVEAACAATAASTALQALRDKGRLKPASRVLIHGASGGVGSYAVQIAKIEGATVWGTCRESKMQFVRELGADEVVDYRATPLAKLGEKFDIVLDAAAKSSFGECRRILARRGAYIRLLPSLGLATGKLRSLTDSRRCSSVVVRSRTADLEQIADWMSAGKLKSHIDSTYRLSALPDALQRLRSGQATGKIGVTIRY